jgi:PIN domain nuclease of toxin-antitoxin system
MERAAQPEVVYLDTHIVLWLHDGLVERLSQAALDTIEAGSLFVSPMVELEIQYLHEIGRFQPTAQQAIDVLAAAIGLRRSELSMRAVVNVACTLDWTRDPFDRLIASEAIAAGGKLVTKDETILAHCTQAVW